MWPIEPMGELDIEVVTSIERRSQNAPWGPETFAGELAREVARIDVLREGGRPGDRVIAFCNYWLVHDEIHLLNLATDPAWRGRGCARRLLGHLIGVGESRRFQVITLEVRRSNARALELYRRHEFRQVGIRRAYYPDNEDAIVMLRELDGGDDDA